MSTTTNHPCVLAQQELDVLGSGAGLNSLINALRNALPWRNGRAAIAPILPDIVGEAAILIWLGRGGALSELGIEPLSCVRRVGGAARSRVCQTLVRTARDFAAAGRDEPVRWLESFTRAIDTDLGALMEIAYELPDQTLVLRELAADLAQQVVDQLRARFAEPTEADTGGRVQAILATILAHLSVRLSALGRREEALAACREAVDIRRRLALGRPDTFLADLATSLGAHSRALAALDRHKEAAQAATDALRMLLPSVQRYPQTYERVARMIIADIQRYSDVAGLRRDESLLKQVAQLLPPDEE